MVFPRNILSVFIRTAALLVLFSYPFFSFSQPRKSFVILECTEQDPFDFANLESAADLAASSYSTPLTILLSPTWTDSILADPYRISMLRFWQTIGHEIGGFHRDATIAGWDGYSNDPSTSVLTAYRDSADAWYARLSSLCGDSLLLSLETAGDEPPVTDWAASAIYRPRPAGYTAGAYSNVGRHVFGPYQVCELGYFRLNRNDSLAPLQDKFFSMNQDAVGIAVTLDEWNTRIMTLVNWMDFLATFRPGTARALRDVMREEGCTVPVHVQQEIPSLPVQVSPNPGSDIVRIISGKGFDIRISDITGRILFQRVSSQKETVVEVQDWPEGIYLVRVSGNEQPAVLRLRVRH